MPIPSDIQPIVAGVFPDPSVCRVGDDYYLATSSFEFSPAVPLFHSTDLVTWTHVGHALTRPSQFASGGYEPSMGIYAPTLRHHHGRFYIITTAVQGGAGGDPEHILVSAPSIDGPWSDPIPVRGLDGADPDLTWDDEGTCLVTYCAVADGRPLGIHQAAIDVETGALLEKPRLIWRGTGLQWPEGPHLYRRGDYWYLLIAEGGTDRGHVVCVARSHDIRGPFDGAPHNPIFSHRSTDHLVESTGHADLVQTPDGHWAAVYLGVRSYGWVPRYHVNGRETFLAGISWDNDWPMFQEDAFQIPDPQHSFVETFDAGHQFDPRWVSPGVALADCTAPRAGGGINVLPAASASGNVSGIFTRPRDRWWDAEISIHTQGGQADVMLRLDERHWYAVRVGNGVAEAVSHIGDTEAVHGEAIVGDDVTVVIRTAEPSFRGPDDVELIAVTSDAEVLLARLDGRYLSMEVAGGFTGRVVGVVARERSVTVTRFEYRSR